MFLTICFILCLLVLFLWKDTKKPENYPPGPRWIPIVGCIPMIKNLLDIFQSHYLIWHYLAMKYGPVVGLRIGRDRMIIVSGKNEIKEFYSRDEFTGRPQGFFYRIRTFGKQLGVVFTDGEEWEVQRRFVMKTLKQIGISRNGFTSHIEREAEEMIAYLKTVEGCLIDMNTIFDVPVLNVMWALVAGYRFHAEDERLLHLIEHIHEGFRIIDMSGGVLNQFPFLRLIFPERTGYNALVRTLKPIWKFLLENIKDIDENGGEECLILAYLREIEASNEEHNADGQKFSAEQLLAILVDIFQAGSETTSNTLGFGILYMLRFPEIMKRVRRELNAAVGRNRLPTVADRTNLQYIEAVICEIQRFANIAPVGIAHRTLQTTKFCGYIIPENTIALISFHTLYRDPNIWIDPNNFRPERFLDQKGRLIQHEALIPFGLGKRRCMGENIARISLFVFFASFFHVFDVVMDDEVALPDIEAVNGITLSPKPYKAYLRVVRD